MPGPLSARGARALCQPGCGDAPGPSQSRGSAPGSSGRRWHLLPIWGLWPHLAVCPGRPAAHVPPACVTVVGLFRAFFMRHLPVLTMILSGSTRGAGKGKTDPQGVLLPWGVSLGPLTPDSSVPHTQHRNVALCLPPQPPASREVGQGPLLRGEAGAWALKGFELCGPWRHSSLCPPAPPVAEGWAGRLALPSGCWDL